MKAITAEVVAALEAQIVAASAAWLAMPDVELLISEMLPEDTAAVCFPGIDGKPCAVVARGARGLFSMNDRELGKFLWWQMQRKAATAECVHGESLGGTCNACSDQHGYPNRRTERGMVDASTTVVERAQ